MPRPNIILILTDDQGWDDLSLHGNPWLQTPNLDQLGRDSVQFANFYVASVCAPSRASLLTGRHFLRTGVSHVHGGHDYIHPEETLMPETFRQAGYRTAMWGKWHSGKTSDYLPWERGFEEAYMAKLYQHRDSTGSFNGQPRQHTGWTNDTLVDYALEFIQRPDPRPFFLYLPFLTVHTPLHAPDALIARYESKGLSRALATIYAMLEHMDTALGRLFQILNDTGQADNTILLFMSDNGPAYSKGLLSDKDRSLRHRSGYKGQKGSMWENGIKSPLFIRWPARFQPTTIHRLADLCDLYPTLLDCCGIDLPENQLPLDGRSLLPCLDGDSESLPPRESFIYINPSWPVHPVHPKDPDEYLPVPPEAKAKLVPMAEHLSLRTETHKLMQHPDPIPGAPEAVDHQVLIHIAEDPREDRNLIPTQPAMAAAMRARLTEWFREIQAEPHAFHAPTFAIGPGTTNVVYLAAPQRLHGRLRNSVQVIEGWTESDDWAEYQLSIRKTDRYRLTLPASTPLPDSFALQLEIAGQRLPLSASPLELELPEGEHVLKLSALHPQDQPIALRQLDFEAC